MATAATLIRGPLYLAMMAQEQTTVANRTTAQAHPRRSVGQKGSGLHPVDLGAEGSITTTAAIAVATIAATLIMLCLLLLCLKVVHIALGLGLSLVVHGSS